MTHMSSVLRTLVRRPRETGAASVGVLTVIGAIVLLAPRPAPPAGPTAVVREGPLAESLIEPGTVSSSRLLLYGSSISGVQVKITDLVPEGRAVVPGDVLIRFDRTTFEQNLAREEAALRQAEAELLRAREERRIEQLRADGEAAQARQQVGYAQSEVANQTDGKGRVALAEAEAAEAAAAREVARARAAYDDMRPMLARGFVTRLEVDRAEQVLRRAEEQLRLAELRRDAMAGFERPAATKRSQSDLDAAQQALIRQREAAQARLAEREAAARAAASHVDEIAARAALLRDQIARCLVTSDAAGLVVYRELFFGNDRRKPQVGDEVWSNQPVIALPDFNQLTVETRIREVDLHHVSVGQPARITLPAYPDLRLDGKVALLGTLAEPDPTRAGTKFFPLTIALDGRDARLRTGMTAAVQINVATLSHATLVPMPAIFDVDGRPTVFVLQRGHATARPVVIAAEDDRDAAVASGVSIGEVVSLADLRRSAAAHPNTAP